MKTPSLVPKSDFLGLDQHIHLAAGGQTPNLVSHLDVLHRFAITKGTGLKGQEENTAVRARAAARCADLLGCEPDDIGFPSSVAHAMGLLADSLPWQPGDNVVVEAWEFPSLINPWLAQRDRGLEIRVLEPDGWRAPLEQVRATVDERTRVLALSHVSYLTGERHDLTAYSKIAGTPVRCLWSTLPTLWGRCRSSPHSQTLCSLAATSGCSYSRHGHCLLEPVPSPGLASSHDRLALGVATPAVGAPLRPRPSSIMAGVFEPGNPTYVGLFVLDNALEYLSRLSAATVEAHDLDLSGQVRDGLLDLGLEVTTPDAPQERAGNTCFATTKALQIRQALEARRVLVTGEDERVRISTHLYNDSDDIEQALAALSEVLQEL